MADSVQYNDPTPNGFPNDYDQKDVDSRTALRTESIRSKMYGKDVREAIAEGVEISSVVSGQAKKTADDSNALSKDTQAQFKAVQQGATSDTEVKTARYSQADGKTYDVLNDRLDAMDAKPQQAVDDIQVGGRNYVIRNRLIGGGIDDTTGELLPPSNNKTATDWITVKSNTEYIWQAPDFHHVQRIFEYDSDKKFIKLNKSRWDEFVYTIKTQPNTKYVRMHIDVSLPTMVNNPNGNQLYKFELGNKATDWTPAPEESHHYQAFRKGTRFFAHRGAQSIAPENSLPAIRKAGNHAGVEIDIHVTSDGVWVVMHDGNVDRTTNGQGAISSFTFSDIRKLRLRDTNNDRTNPFSDSELVIPTLEEALTACKDQRLIPVVEIKIDDSDKYTADNYDNLVDIIKSYGVEDQMMFISFDYNALKEIKKRMPLVEVSYLVHDIDDDVMQQAQQLGVNSGVDSNYTGKGVKKENITKAHELGLKVGLWTTKDDSNRQELLAMGVDFITTNSLSGEYRFEQIQYKSGFSHYVNNYNYKSVIQEVRPGEINICFIVNKVNNAKGTVFATLPDWATPNNRFWNPCTVRASGGVQLGTFDIDGADLKVGFNWDKMSSGGWITGNVTYHV